MNALPLLPDALIETCDTLKTQGFRFVTITCLELDENNLDMIYHFDKDLELVHYRMQVKKNQIVPSLSPVFFAAFLVENEIIDQFGVTFDGLVLDFGGTLYLDNDDGEVNSTPLCKYSVTQAASSSTPQKTPSGKA